MLTARELGILAGGVLGGVKAEPRIADFAPRTRFFEHSIGRSTKRHKRIDVSALVQKRVMTGAADVDAMLLVFAEKLAVGRDERRTLLVAVSAKDRRTGQELVVVLLGLAGRNDRIVIVLPAHAATEIEGEPRHSGRADDDVKRIADLPQKRDDPLLTLLVALINERRVEHGVVVERLELTLVVLLGLLDIAAESSGQTVEAGHTAHAGMNIGLLGLEITLGHRELEGKDLDRHGDGGESLALARNGYITLVKTALLVLVGLDRDEELLERVLFERNRQHLVGIAKAFMILVEAGLVVIGLLGSGDPVESLLAALAHAGIVGGLLVLDDLDEVLVVKQKLRRKLKAGIVEIADPAVAVLEPELDYANVVLEGKIYLDLDIVHVLERKELERARLELALREHASDGSVQLAVFRPCIVKAHNLAHRGNCEIGDVALHARIPETLGINLLKLLGAFALSIPNGILDTGQRIKRKRRRERSRYSRH